MAKKEDIQNQKDLNNEKRETANIDRDINNETSRTKTLEEQIIELLSTRRGINSDVLSDQQDIANSLQDQVKQQQFLRLQQLEQQNALTPEEQVELDLMRSEMFGETIIDPQSE